MHQSHQHSPGQHPTFNELLINEVKAHPQLYNQQHRVCTDNGERNVIWEVIAQRIDESVSGEFAKKRWLQMRDRYRKELKMAIRTSVQPKWPYFVKLSWLDPYLKGAKKIDSDSNSLNGQSNNILNDLGIAPNNKQQDFAGINGIFSAAENNDNQLQFPLPTVKVLEVLMAASKEFLERQQLTQESVCTSSSVSNNDMNTQQQQNVELSDNATIASSSTNNDEGVGEQNFLSKSDNKETEMLFMTEAENTQLVGNGKDTGVTKDGTEDGKQKYLKHQLRPRLRNNLIRSGLIANNNINYVKHLQRTRHKPSFDYNTKLSKVGKFDINSFRSLNENGCNNIGDGNAYLEEMETATTMLDDNEDEDYLFARLVVARLKKFEPKKRREMRSRINQWLDQEEDKIEMEATDDKPENETTQSMDVNDLVQ